MRIQHLRFKNLNSLTGEWSIDLTHPAFASDGIFAITGPTGAGKSTILDAICLALYGRTPRLSKVTKSGNEIMSRQTGECFAEVTFETQTGHFRCHWSQHRARRKSGGELQAPKHEIADAGSGQIIGTSIRDVAGRIETATGMDFERFTRSMLLAQGGFAAFLDAAADERAPILEQITGTEIYSRISMRVHARRGEERKTLEGLTAELAGLRLLDAEDEATLKAGLDGKLVLDAELGRQVVAQQTAIAWLDRIAQLDGTLAGIALRNQDWQARQSAFQPDRDRLERANRALELAGEHGTLASLRGQQARDGESRAECVAAIPAQEALAKTAEAAFQTAVQDLESRKTKQRTDLLIIRQVRDLDLRIEEKAGPIEATTQSVGAQEQALATLRTRHADDSAALEQQRQSLDTLLGQLEDTRTDADLVGQLGRIQGQFAALGQLGSQQAARRLAAQTAETAKTQADRQRTTAATDLDARLDQLKQAQALLSQRQGALQALFQGREIGDWRAELATRQGQMNQLEKLGEALRSRTDAKRTRDDLRSSHAALEAQGQALTGKLEQGREGLGALEREMHLLETQLSLLRRIQDLAEARHQLRDGEPCPLCGAEAHPFAEGNIPVPDETASALQRVRAEVKTAHDALTHLQVQQAETAKDLAQCASRQEDCSVSIRTAETVLEQGRLDLGIADAQLDWDDHLPRLRQESQDRLALATGIVLDGEALEKEIVAQRDRLEQTREAAAQAERAAQLAAHQQDSAGQTLEHARAALDTLAGQLDAALAEARSLVSVHGIADLSIDDLEQTLQTLTGRRDQWLARQARRETHEREIAALELRTGHAGDLIDKSVAEIAQARGQLDALERERDLLASERRALFADQDPDQEEARLAAAITTAEQVREGARQRLGDVSEALGRLKHRFAELETSIAARAEQLLTMEAAFVARLGLCRFTDEAGYLSACLPEEARKDLTRLARQLDQEQIELTAQDRETRGRLDAERLQAVTDRPRGAVEETLNALLEQHRALQQEIGGLRQTLDDNAGQRRQQQERAQAIEQQRRECARWDLLHELIGSADGKKYRNFAQGLTFELMVDHANRQLRKMTDRYLLVRDAAQPLDLNVVDSYQAGETRSTRNLSGGESFIVSLSLALGLSRMASQNVRVDSLFLDEGFGTLDEEALDTALETLAGLRQDGKLIGIISHVPALKERIATRIEVMPGTDGRSRLQGPGCG